MSLFPQPAIGPSPAVGPTAADVAGAHLADARRSLDDAAASLRLAARLDWDSAAGAACRAEIAQVIGGIDATSGTLDQAVVVTRAVGS